MNIINTVVISSIFALLGYYYIEYKTIERQYEASRVIYTINGGV